jgi:hypothetical protein
MIGSSNFTSTCLEVANQPIVDWLLHDISTCTILMSLPSDIAVLTCSQYVKEIRLPTHKDRLVAVGLTIQGKEVIVINRRASKSEFDIALEDCCIRLNKTYLCLPTSSVSLESIEPLKDNSRAVETLFNSICINTLVSSSKGTIESDQTDWRLALLANAYNKLREFDLLLGFIAAHDDLDYLSASALAKHHKHLDMLRKHPRLKYFIDIINDHPT